jgi:hypothetical protein
VINSFNFPNQLKVAGPGFGSAKAGHTEDAAHANPSVVRGGQSNVSPIDAMKP